MFRLLFALLLLWMLVAGVGLAISGQPHTGLMVLCAVLGLLAIPMAFVVYPVGLLMMLGAVTGSYWVSKTFG